jgi:hypothetical protein
LFKPCTGRRAGAAKGAVSDGKSFGIGRFSFKYGLKIGVMNSKGFGGGHYTYETVLCAFGSARLAVANCMFFSHLVTVLPYSVITSTFYLSFFSRGVNLAK